MCETAGFGVVEILPGTQRFFNQHAVLKTEQESRLIMRLSVFPRLANQCLRETVLRSVCAKLFYVSFHGAAVAKVLPTAVARECHDACVMYLVSLQTVHRGKPHQFIVKRYDSATYAHNSPYDAMTHVSL